jgi:hypothetical protein
MFDDILMATCQREFEAKVKKLFELNQQSGKKTCEVPYLGGPYCTDVGGDHAGLQQRVVDALIARKRFEWTGPDWVDELPLRSEAINVLEEDADPRLRLVALYADSLRRQNWDYRTHPEFPAYARGLMAYDGTPTALRMDPRLRKEFPPMKLDGLADECLHWRTPEGIAEDRALAAWVEQAKDNSEELRPEFLRKLREQEVLRHEPGHC